MSAARLGGVQPRLAAERLLSSWDKGNKTARHRILRDFINTQSGKTTVELEEEFAMMSCLFLTRMVAWLQLNLGGNEPVHLLLRSLNVFLSAAGGTDFIAEFSKMGGVALLLESIKSTKSGEKDKQAGLACIRSIMSAGVKFQVLLCRSRGVEALGECLGVSRDPNTQEVARDLLETLPDRNEEYLDQVYAVFVKTLSAPSFQARYLSVISLPALQRRMSKPPATSMIEPLVDLLECGDLQVQHEVYQLMKLLLEYGEVQLALVQAILRGLRPPENLDVAKALAPEVKVPDGAEDVTFEPALPLYIRQAACAGFIRLFVDGHNASDKNDVAVLTALGKEHAAEYLLHALGNLSYADSRKHAAQALQSLLKHGCQPVRDTLVEAVGDDFPYVLQDAVDINDFSLNITPLQSETVRSALVRLDYAGNAL